MMCRLLGATFLAFLFSFTATGAPLATVTSDAALKIRGVAVPVVGVPLWPLADGDEVTTTTASAVIVFPDRNRITLDKDSRVKLHREGQQITVSLLQGTLSLKRVSGSSLRVAALDQTIQPPAGSEMAVTLNGGTVVTRPALGSTKVQPGKPGSGLASGVLQPVFDRGKPPGVSPKP